ncbi:MAG: N-glycosylase/DNA lyase [Candidatus Methanofastidiosia archaeon]
MNNGKTPYMDEDVVMELNKIYFSIQDQIKVRINDFGHLGDAGSEESIFSELVFCILTPQSRARSCWNAVKNLTDKNLLLRGNEKSILGELNGVRFKYKKAQYVIEAGKQFSIDGKISLKPRIDHFNNIQEARDWLVQNVKGIGYKEASHFLRNIGRGKDLAILDRHILKNLKMAGIIDTIPSFFSRKKYCEIEKRMEDFAKRIDIPLSHLDIVMWYRETGEVFK